MWDLCLVFKSGWKFWIKVILSFGWVGGFLFRVGLGRFGFILNFFWFDKRLGVFGGKSIIRCVIVGSVSIIY